MKKFIIYLLPIFFINSSIVYSEEVITINNDTLYNKNNLKKKIYKALKEGNYDLSLHYSQKLLKISPNEIIPKIHFIRFSSTQNSLELALKNPTKVKKLILYSNLNSDLTFLPDNLSKLINLKVLNIQINKLKNIDGIGNLENLEELSLRGNNIKYISKEIKNLTKLKKLELSDNLITEIPREIGDLKNLEELHLNNNKIKEIPKEIKNLTKLKKLELYDNLITEIPREIGDLKNLEELDISSQFFNEYIKRHINIYYDEKEKIYLPSEITKLNNLKYLKLSPSIVENLPDKFSLLPLKSLNIRLDKNINQVKNLEKISRITSLESLSMRFYSNEKIPISFSNLSSLKELEVSSFSNKKSSNIIDLVKLVSSNNNLRKLSINSTSIKTLPDEIIPILSKLEILDLSSNNIEEIPDEIGNLLKLKELNLIGNKITNVPDSISKLEDLEILSLTSNKITNIPSSISKLKNLKSLYLSSNNIEKIPDEIGNLSKLKHLSLSNNKLSDSTKNHIKSTLKTLSLNL